MPLWKQGSRNICMHVETRNGLIELIHDMYTLPSSPPRVEVREERDEARNKVLEPDEYEPAVINTELNGHVRYCLLFTFSK